MTAKMSVSAAMESCTVREKYHQSEKECEIWHTIGAYLVAGSAPPCLR